MSTKNIFYLNAGIGIGNATCIISSRGWLYGAPALMFAIVAIGCLIVIEIVDYQMARTA